MNLRPLLAVCGFLLVLLGAPTGTSARRPLVHGRLIDDATRRPIGDVAVHLLTTDGHRVATALTDSLGRFRISPNVAGQYTLRAERIGYQSAESRGLKILDGDTIRVEFWLSTAAVLLAPLEVKATARPWTDRYTPAGLDPFYERMRWFKPLGGLFSTRAELHELEGLPMSTVLATLGRGRTDLNGNVVLRMNCRPQYYLNGMPYAG